MHDFNYNRCRNQATVLSYLNELTSCSDKLLFIWTVTNDFPIRDLYINQLAILILLEKTQLSYFYSNLRPDVIIILIPVCNFQISDHKFNQCCYSDKNLSLLSCHSWQQMRKPYMPDTRSTAGTRRISSDWPNESVLTKTRQFSLNIRFIREHSQFRFIHVATEDTGKSRFGKETNGRLLPFPAVKSRNNNMFPCFGATDIK